MELVNNYSYKIHCFVLFLPFLIVVLEEKEDRELFHRSLQQLKEPYKQVIILRCYSELSFKEIEEVFSKGEN